MIIKRFTEEQMITLASAAIRKIDTRGRRGAEMVTHEEIEAMAAMLVVLKTRLKADLPTLEHEGEKE